MSVNVPTLSSGGFISDPALKLERLIAYFFIADYSQSNQHSKRVASLPYLIKQYGSTPNILVDRIQTTLETMLSAYFEAASVEVEEEDPLSADPQYNIILQGTVTHAGKRYDISRLLTVANSTLSSVSELQVK